MIRTAVRFLSACCCLASVSAADNIKHSSSTTGADSCRFAPSYTCDDFSKESTVDQYISSVMKWEGQFARENVGYDAFTGEMIVDE
jgi:hypothetical protein